MSVYPAGLVVERRARISPDGLYRYGLIRKWNHEAQPATFIMLNPSTADGTQDDPTIRRCVGFAQALGCGGIVVVNLYAYRATKPADLWQAEDPVGPENDARIRANAAYAATVRSPLVAAWGTQTRARDRIDEVLELIRGTGAELTALGVTRGGHPRHPLYLPGDARPARWPA